jgi:hypothetical protein
MLKQIKSWHVCLLAILLQIAFVAYWVKATPPALPSNPQDDLDSLRNLSVPLILSYRGIVIAIILAITTLLLAVRNRVANGIGAFVALITGLGLWIFNATPSTGSTYIILNALGSLLLITAVLLHLFGEKKITPRTDFIH